MKTMLDPIISDPKAPQHRRRWRRVPRRLGWLCFVLSMFAYESRTTVIKPEPLLISYDYELTYIRLYQTSGGVWYVEI